MFSVVSNGQMINADSFWKLEFIRLVLAISVDSQPHQLDGKTK